MKYISLVGFALMISLTANQSRAQEFKDLATKAFMFSQPRFLKLEAAAIICADKFPSLKPLVEKRIKVAIHENESLERAHSAYWEYADQNLSSDEVSELREVLVKVKKDWVQYVKKKAWDKTTEPRCVKFLNALERRMDGILKDPNIQGLLGMLLKME